MTTSPFEVTKAVDFTDEEISVRFVSFSAADYPLVDPRSPITQYLVGGKGGGRTHLMRFYAYPLQKERATSSVLARLQQDGYIGIYAPASGLDGSRFQGARIELEAWRAVFAQSLEMRLVLLLLDVLEDIQRADEIWSTDAIATFAEGTMALVDGLNYHRESASLSALRSQLFDVQREVDSAVNNAPLTKALDVAIRFNPGRLIFGVGALVQTLPGLAEVKLTYMLDELENLTEDQQRFINTLVREKQLPTCFLIGSREWGIRTYSTLSADEDNREGSEFKKVVPEHAYSQSEESYKTFCFDMIQRRLRASGYREEQAKNWIGKLDLGRTSPLMDAVLLETIKGGEGRHLTRLRSAVQRATSDAVLSNAAVEAVRFEGHPLLEKLAILKAYQGWSASRVFSPKHFTAAREFIAPIADGSADGTAMNFLNLWRKDLIAQIFADQSTEQRYSGIDTFIRMSGHLPRSLLVILKYVTSRASWRGEDPFTGMSPIPVGTQSDGVREASAWYLNDVRPLGDDGVDCDRAIRRLGSLLRDIRYSDKPSEVSLTTFSSNFEGVSPAAALVIENCVKHRLLLEIPGGRQARNQGSVHRKFQIHPMLSPFFGLGFGRRGDLSLAGDEVMALFSPTADESVYQGFARKCVAPMRAPFSDPAANQLF
ncbi:MULTISPECIES: hypothetical protein [unclassified Rathayibacter]|uniref:ORC-CDC6 family AAA ATPase n=1 Tax=unclassified Rathayibacter TaxID=2609250 RepID=UPI0011AFF44E|nr:MULTISPECIES: hypothetical protein [unclassified Rathayibacter]